ncbi:helicase HerA domain-containing protein [Vibrio natriegens]|uniref:helicase HerA domain-containing protein n=1 Tax=Vibrio natriegens TaxID=691 RepID=UPI003F8609A0
MTDDFLNGELSSFTETSALEASQALTELIDEDLVVGDLINIDYSECQVLVHDALRQAVGGIPLGCFLVASRFKPGSKIDPTEEDSSLILLRVIGKSKLPNELEALDYRFKAGQRASDSEHNWDAEGKTDQYTLHILRYSGLTCRVLGSLRLNEEGHSWHIKFTSDISNFYSGKGMKVYKPVGDTLSKIVNYKRPKSDDAHPLAGNQVNIGRVRYASTEINQNSPVLVDMDPTDFLSRKTALFGMSRTGKSNTTKVKASATFKLRDLDVVNGRVGQLILDLNGEYANENTQDGSLDNPICLKLVYKNTQNSSPADVVTYGLEKHPNDPDRRLAKINFYGNPCRDWKDSEALEEQLAPLFVGKQIIDNHLATEDAKYIRSFRDTNLDIPKILDSSSSTRFKRLVLFYRAVLYAAGFEPPIKMKPNVPLKGLFGCTSKVNIINALSSCSEDNNSTDEYLQASEILKKASCSWDDLEKAAGILLRFMEDNDSGYKEFERDYRKNSSTGQNWADKRLVDLLQIFKYTNGPRSIKQLIDQHDPNTFEDFAASIAEDLVAGKLVIFDQSLGDPVLAKHASERIMWAIFDAQKKRFVVPEKDEKGYTKRPPEILVYVEEAHNLLPKGSDFDVTSIWSRTAKEGSKYHIGMVYATQEPSSIQPNILKNTDNWFVAHLNNTDEVKIIEKYYDFRDFSAQVIQVPDPGFVRMRTLSNPFVVPVQIKKFTIEG